ncbi:MAG: hypothetical protein O2960_29230 [Verrucomicrobia bacterium]|nr:hypothetical protein [Verrucomicrobiota bacterium]
MKSKVVEIEFHEKQLQAQLPAIRGSQVEAWKTLCRRACIKAKRLTISDTREAWNFAMGFQPLRECVQSLLTDIIDEAKFHGAFLRLAEISKHGKMNETDFDTKIDPTDRFLVNNWTWLRAIDLGNPDEANPVLAKLCFRRDEEVLQITPEFLQSSLCLHSDIAMAKAVFYFRSGRLPRDEQLPAQANALRSRYTRLGLLTSTPRLFKDFSAGKHCQSIPFQVRIAGQ